MGKKDHTARLLNPRPPQPKVERGYYGPGSTGKQNPNPQPVQHAISNPPYYHSDYQFPGEDYQHYTDRMYAEWYERGMQPLPKEWDVQRPGGAGALGTGVAAQPSPFLFPGGIPEGGVRLPSGEVFKGQVQPGGAIVGQGGQPVGQVNYGGGGGGVGGSSISFLDAPAQAQGGGSLVQGGGGKSIVSLGGASGGAGASGIAGTPSDPNQAQADALLQQQRDLAFNELDAIQRLYDGPFSKSVQDALTASLSGQDAPFTQNVVDRIFAKQASQAGAGHAARAEQLRNSFAARGLSGSGLEQGALQESQALASGQRSSSLNDVLIQQQLENFSAKERARAESQGFLANQAAGLTPPLLEKARMRSRWEVTGDAPGDQQASAIASLAAAIGAQNSAQSPFAANLNIPLGPLNAPGGIVPGYNGTALGGPAQQFGPQLSYPQQRQQGSGGGLNSTPSQNSLGAPNDFFQNWGPEWTVAGDPGGWNALGQAFGTGGQTAGGAAGAYRTAMQPKKQQNPAFVAPTQPKKPTQYLGNGVWSGFTGALAEFNRR